MPGDRAAWISIPAAGVEHPIGPQGLSADGTINPASGQVIWFSGYDRVEPGRVGTSVVAGHVTYGDRPDVFASLTDVQQGDSVQIGYDDGTVLDLTVVSTQLVDKNDLQHSETVWGGNSGVRRVAIITCDDALGLRDDGHRVANYVVIAEVG